MDDLARLRSLVYERNKYGAGWGTRGAVGRTYVREHACYCHNGHQPVASHARFARYGESFREPYFSADGDGNGDCTGSGIGSHDPAGRYGRTVGWRSGSGFSAGGSGNMGAGDQSVEGEGYHGGGRLWAI